MNKIFVITETVYPDDTGGKKLILGRIFDARISGFNPIIVHYNYTQVPEEKIQEMKVFFQKYNIEYYPYIPKSHRKNKLLRFIFYFYSLFSLTAEPVFYINKNKGFKNLVENVVSKKKPEIISIESMYLYRLISSIFLKKYSKEIIFQNMESEFYKQLSLSSVSLIKKIYYYIESLKIKKIENYIFTANENLNIICLTESDRDKYLNHYRFHSLNNKIIINRNHLFSDKVIKRCVDFNKPFFLFPGSLLFPPNRFGLDWLLKDYDKKICNKGLCILVTGSVDEELKNYFSNYNCINLIGYVSEQELNKLYENCIAIISPIITGGGIKIKNLEAISLKVPLIATEFSLEGISDLNQQIVKTDNDSHSFFEGMINYYNNLIHKI